jgi:hypothetical protein
MTRIIKILPRIVKRLHKERLIRREPHAAPVLVGKLRPPDITLIAVVLGTNIVDKLTVDGRLVNAD